MSKHSDNRRKEIDMRNPYDKPDEIHLNNTASAVLLERIDLSEYCNGVPDVEDNTIYDEDGNEVGHFQFPVS